MREADFNKYLRKNPAPDLTLPPGTTTAAVIPVYNEADELPATLDSLLASVCASAEKTMLLFVVNEPAGTDNTSSLQALEIIDDFAAKHNCIRALYAPQLANGVGEARKTGMDAICRQLTFGELKSFVLCSLDADTHISKEYFTIVPAAVRRNSGALTIGFRHRTSSDPATEKAIRIYENYLDRYVTLLKMANSPYAFHTVGSAFAVRADAYIASGGMRMRQAGEDFYFLQAAAKATQVRTLDEILVHPSPRASARVPFGTGPAVSRIIAGEMPQNIPEAAFEALGEIITLSHTSGRLDSPQNLLSALPQKCRDFFIAEKFPELWQKVLNNLPENEKKRQKAFHDWFDGLKTLRFLHFFEKFLIK